LAWPEDYFHNYIALLNKLNIEIEKVVELPFCVHEPDKRMLFNQKDPNSNGWKYFEKDL
jgi:hypothetical protein